MPEITNQQPNSPQVQPIYKPGQDLDTFINEVQAPRIPAVQEGAAPQPSGIPLPGNNPSPAPAYVAPEGAKRLFDDDEIETLDDGDQNPGGGTGDAQPKGPSKNYKDKVIDGVIKGSDSLISKGFALWANEDDWRQLASDPEDLEDIKTYSEPFHEWIIDKCPAALPLGFAVVGLLLGKGNKARKLRKMNKENEAAANDHYIMSKAADAINNDGERSNFTLYSDGYYARDKKGTYIKRPSRDLEAPLIADIEKILAVKANCNKRTLRKAFGWTDADFQKHGITA